MNGTASFCSTKSSPYFSVLTRHYHFDNFLLVFAVVNAVVAVVASCSNVLVIYIFGITPSLRTPSNILVLGLSISDLGIAALSQPSFIVFLVAQYRRDACLFVYSRLVYIPSLLTLAVVSLLTLTAITADRFLAVQLHLRYQELVTTKRYGITIALIWLVSLSFSTGRLILGNNQTVFVIGAFCGVAVLLLDAFFLFKISQVIHRHSVQIHAHSVQQNLNMPRYKKSVNTMVRVIGGFLLCYIIFIVALISYIFLKFAAEAQALFIAGVTFTMLNGVLNPYIYYTRIPEIRNTAVRLISSKIGIRSENQVVHKDQTNVRMENREQARSIKKCENKVIQVNESCEENQHQANVKN